MRPFLKRYLTHDTLTINEVAALTGLSIPYIRLRVQKGQLPAVLRGSVYLIDREDAEALKRN